MPGRSEGSMAALLLTQRLVEAAVQPLKASEYWSVIERVSDPAELLGEDPASVARAAGIEGDLAERIAQLLDAATSFAFELDVAEQSGLRVVASVEDDYPSTLIDRLGRQDFGVFSGDRAEDFDARAEGGRVHVRAQSNSRREEGLIHKRSYASWSLARSRRAMWFGCTRGFGWEAGQTG